MTEAPDRSAFAGAPDRPVFVGGAPRSGTTLLRLMLNNAPELGMPRETQVVVRGWDERRKFGDLSVEANRRALADRICELLPSPTSRRLGLPPEKLHARIVKAPPTLGSILGTCLLTYAERYKKPRWGDKRPAYARYLDAVFSMFPDAQFIHVIRDPRASAASMAQMWYEGAVAPGVELWERTQRAVEVWRPLLAQDQLLELYYEDLVAEPRKTLERVAAFLTLDPASVDAMLRYHEDPDETSPVHQDVTKPPTVDNVEKWRSTLTPSEVALAERVTGPWMDRYGYDREAPAGARPSLADTWHFRQRVWGEGRKRRRRQLGEIRVRLSADHPVTARLTSSQRAGAEPPAMPPFRQRLLGRPR